MKICSFIEQITFNLSLVAIILDDKIWEKTLFSKSITIIKLFEIYIKYLSLKIIDE